MTLKSPRTLATIEARMTSSRLPGKVLKPVLGRPMLALMVERLRRVSALDGIVIATTVNATDDPLVDLAENLGVGVFRGSEDDVMGRVLGAARAHGADVIVETTGDCPLIDPAIVQRCVEAYAAADVDYLSNVLTRSYPIGMDTQVFAADILADAAARTDDPRDREHVSLYIYNHPERYRLQNVAAPPALRDPNLALTLDTAEDLALIAAVFEALYPENPDFRLDDILRLLARKPELREINRHVRE
ncbi:cytidylyltransferase domain-containing protein [Varunaivibrio sulfuroxidans]|uniref:Spore coat polysaccharide biosynthesis protein SpsF n=1 Tax=Varunaivibrio sulfuroxidans TaxID=1773489 RepID=A0A4R3JCB5_9PROT|nr:glycosyltransferase family protein [Varunaivibrio sulfuroxidans]TCS62995.1 spore coat polysaccharide biosynthesis protein SpsF [Varunaivibrio sulfuroxidans]WES31927.1 glycosyltransferase family protein [Varunaivibrio sulfuroxidans]